MSGSPRLPDELFGIYVHWPYCAKICPYCDFNVYAAKSRNNSALEAAILKDIEGYGGIWVDIEGYGGRWKEMEGYGGRWKDMEGYGRMWREMEGYGRIWKEMEG